MTTNWVEIMKAQALFAAHAVAEQQAQHRTDCTLIVGQQLKTFCIERGMSMEAAVAGLTVALASVIADAQASGTWIIPQATIQESIRLAFERGVIKE